MNNAIQENDNCSETYASFRICGDNLVTQEVTEHLRMEPAFACEKGDTFRSRAGLLVRLTGVWLITSENKIQSTSLERHLAYLIGKLRPTAAQIQYFVEHAGYCADFVCYWVSATGHGGPVLSNGMLKQMASLSQVLPARRSRSQSGGIPCHCPKDRLARLTKT